MERIVHVTIKDIIQYWRHPQLSRFHRIKDRRLCCQMLLPDLFQSANCLSPTAYSYFEADGGLDSDALRLVVNGNRKSLSGFVQYLGNAGFTQDLIDILNRNIPFRIRSSQNSDGKDRLTTPRENLFQKIKGLVATSNPPLSAQSPLLSQIHLEPDQPNGLAAEAYAQLRKTVQKLLMTDTIQGYAYIVMIYVLAGWLQWRIEELPWLWDWEAIREYLSMGSPERMPANSKEHIPFDAEAYMHQYHVYLLRSTRPQLFEEGFITMEPNSLFGSQITLQLRYQSGDDPNHFQQRTFTGHPTLSTKDVCVYALMKDQNGAMAHLYFSYKPFNANMYYRQGILITKDPDSPAPLAQKIVLSHRKLAHWEEPYAEGILSDSGDFIPMTPQMLTQFCKQFQDEIHYPWLPFFHANVLPVLQTIAQNAQIFNCQLIRSQFLGQLTELEILQITLALKSIPIPGFEREGRFLWGIDNLNAHLLFR